MLYRALSMWALVQVRSNFKNQVQISICGSTVTLVFPDIPGSFQALRCSPFCWPRSLCCPRCRTEVSWPRSLQLSLGHDWCLWKNHTGQFTSVFFTTDNVMNKCRFYRRQFEQHFQKTDQWDKIFSCTKWKKSSVEESGVSSDQFHYYSRSFVTTSCHIQAFFTDKCFSSS